MKYIISIIFLLVIGGTAFSGSMNYKPNQQDSAKKVFIDENKNGIDDRDEKGNGNCYRGRRRDRFEDKDGDGICDEREGTIGPKRRHRGGKNENK